MSSYKILDCTLRDGGYYTNWNFETQLVRDLVKSLDENSVDIIELGYKSPSKGGPYRKCNDGFIKDIINFKIKAKLAFMIDVKDFIEGDEVDVDLIKDIVKPKQNSLFSVCRIAAKSNEIRFLPEMISILQDLGYTVYCNLMGITITPPEEINSFVNTVLDKKIEGVYIADSYGALIPSKVRELFNEYKLTGIHTHDNMGLAFANCLEAIDNGATFIDGTLTGMGRGVGNVRTEQLVLYRNNKITSSLMDTIDLFEVIKSKYKWGHNSLYMIAGMNHIHPLYAQDLNQSNLENTGIIKATNALKENLSYDSSKLEHLKKQKSVVIIPARYKSTRFPGKPLAKINGKEMILHVAEKAEIAVGKENVYVATENKEISKVVKKSGYQVVLTSDNCLTGTDRVAEASKEIEADIFINVQGDEPMVDPNDIIKVINAKQNHPNHVINCASKLHPNEDPNDKKIPKVVCSINNDLLYSSRNAIPGTKTGDGKNVMKQVCIYGFSKNQLNEFNSISKSPLEFQEDIEILRFLEKGIPVKMVETDKVSYAVDYPEDVKIIENQLN